jgi:aminoglycoside/choline kinase family phosphotransferase
VHRDFQSQNIIARSGHAYLIDFQGMRPGLAEYDLASLLFDPYVRSRRMSGRNFTLIIWSAAAYHRLPKCGKRFGYAQCNA